MSRVLYFCVTAQAYSNLSLLCCNIHKKTFIVLSGSAATQLRCGGRFYSSFMQPAILTVTRETAEITKTIVVKFLGHTVNGIHAECKPVDLFRGWRVVTTYF